MGGRSLLPEIVGQPAPVGAKLLIICPMRQQHWTDYKISLCVCQSLSVWVSERILGPSISLERLKLETPNLAHRLATGGLNEKCKIRSKGVVKGSRDLLLEFWDPLHISAAVEARNFKFGMEIGHWGTETKKNAKLGQKGSGRVTWPRFRILGPPPYLGNGWSYKLQICQVDWPLGLSGQIGHWVARWCNG